MNNNSKVLIQENLIKNIENEIQKLKNISNFYKKTNPKRFIPKTFITTLMSTLVLSTIPAFFNFPLYVLPIDALIGNISFSTFVMVAVGIILVPYGIITDLIEFNYYKKNINEELAVNGKIYYLSQKLLKEKKVLTTLTKNNECKNVKDDIIKNLIELKKSLEQNNEQTKNLEKGPSLILKRK